MIYKTGNKVLFKDKKYIDNNIGSGQAIGNIKDFDGDYAIIETGIGEHYILIKDIIKVLK